MTMTGRPAADRQELGEQLYTLLVEKRPLIAAKLTGMILELPDLGIHDIINDSEKRDELSASGLQILVESVHQGYTIL
jgi:hypothetical protein